MKALALLPQHWRADLNLAVPLFAFGWITLAPWITTEVARLRGEDVDAPDRFVADVDIFGALGLLLVLMLLARAVGLAPRRINPRRAGMNRLGHRVLAAVNLAVLATTVLPILVAKLTGIEAIGHLTWLGLPVLVVAGFAWPIAVLLVWVAWDPHATPGSST